jgi:uroporphyrinogen-III decarboxylase
MTKLSSRERMLRALSCRPVDHPPCCCMLLHALDEWSRGEADLIAAQADWGLDPLVVLPSWSLTRPGDPADLRGYQFDYPQKVNVTLRGLPVHPHPAVRIREWLERPAGEPHPTLHREYHTPEEILSVVVNRTSDWPYGDRLPFVDDFIIPRARKNLIGVARDLKALAYLLQPPDGETVRHFRAASQANRRLAAERDLLLVYQWGVLADMAAWLCGLQELVYLTADQPDLVADLLDMIAAWNLERMRVVLDEGIDLWVRRGWYEGSDFWSPVMYRRFILPHLTREVETAHARGVKFGYILTSGAMPLLDMILEAGVDVLIGADPIQGDMDLRALKDKARGRLCLWGGVNGPLTVEAGTPEQIRGAVRQALDLLAPGGGFILSPVDGIYDASQKARSNMEIFVDAWKEWCRSDPNAPSSNRTD